MHFNSKITAKLDLDEGFYSATGSIILESITTAKILHNKLNLDNQISYQELFSIGLINEIFAKLWSEYIVDKNPQVVDQLFTFCQKELGPSRLDTLIKSLANDYEKMNRSLKDDSRLYVFEAVLVHLNNTNTAIDTYRFLLAPNEKETSASLNELAAAAEKFFDKTKVKSVFDENFISVIKAPQLLFPHSIQLQLEYIKSKLGHLIGDLLQKLSRAIDFINERNQYFLRRSNTGGPGPTRVMDFGSGSGFEEYERFSQDRDWMPKVVLLAKTTLVWLYQLSKKYNRHIATLDNIPDEEIAELAYRGFNCLWLIGLWERSDASRKIKNWCGNPEAAASAYSLYDYQIAGSIGGWPALEKLKNQCMHFGIRLASDMVPNHTGIESLWLYQHPDWYIQTSHPPFPSYTYNSGNLSSDPNFEVTLEDHYYSKNDAAVTFRLIDKRTGQTRYIYHGNDGTNMPWNDTAQLNYLLADVREAVIQMIISVARNFSVIRFDAAMTLAKRHIQRLWFPEPGHGGDIPSRSEYGLSQAEFNALLPVEFWREVVDRVAQEAPDTLLLAEAFWMMEGYFVRTLGMHRVYNSAFMNMLKNEENAKYRASIKNVLTFDKDILKRFVNFMNNPDEDTAYAQFGDGDKYFGVCTLMATLPGLPMFGHGQIEGFTEKYGMEYQKAYKDESPIGWFIERHDREIFPILKMRYRFSGSEYFNLYDFISTHHSVNENVFAFSNRIGNEVSLVAFNNSYERANGSILISNPFLDKYHPEKHTQTMHIAHALGIPYQANYFTLFRNIKTNLWYIRSSKQLHEQGISFILNGYEAQVYVDFYSIEDNEMQYYAKINHKQNGEGFKSIDELIKQEFLAPLYDLFKTSFAQAKAAKTAAELLAINTEIINQIQLKGFAQIGHTDLDDLNQIEDLLARVTANQKSFEALAKKFDEDPFLRSIAQLDQADVLFTLLVTCLHENNKVWSVEKELPLSDVLVPYLKKLGLAKSFDRQLLKARDCDDLQNSIVKDFIDVHEFEGNKYFNKESLLIYSLFYASKVEKIYEAMIASKYDYEVLIELLSPKKKPVKKSK